MIRQAVDPERDVEPGTVSISAAEFAAQFQASFRILWLIAVGILGDASLAEDVVQEAAIIALGKLDQFRVGTNFSAWTGQIVRNVALNRARRERKHRAASVDPLALDETTAAPGASAVDGGLRSGRVQAGGADRLGFDVRLARALAGVGDVARACLLLRTLEGMEYSQISILLGIPEGTAMSHVHRTRRTLREQLADLWKERTDGSATGGLG